MPPRIPRLDQTYSDDMDFEARLTPNFRKRVETEFAMQVIERARLKLGNHEHFIGNRKLGDVDSIGSGLHKSVAGIICRMAEQKTSG